MPLFEWTDGLSVGVEAFDRHHRHLIELINILHESETNGEQRSVLEEVLTELSNYTLYHFLAEEDAMERLGFPGRDEHRKEHLLLTDRTLEFLRDYESGKVQLTAELLDFLTNWLKHHIIETDKEYGPFLNERGMF